MSTHSRTWKSRVAGLFGESRQVQPSSSGRDDLIQRDSTHPNLFIETRYGQRHAARSLFEEIKTLARKGKKTPILALIDNGRPGMLLCIHSDDLPSFVAEYTLANPEAVETAQFMAYLWHEDAERDALMRLHDSEAQFHDAG